ncbi:hypothetical protein [Pendulispora albinea]|uniref:ATP synthase subunit b n=1 Tax=Pendulispora albinea TaxID=2741071 RepID=A0ABZ2M5D9_9BACT
MSLVMMGAVDSSLMRAAQGAVDVDFDLTMLGQVVLFLILMAVLKPLLFDPMLKLFEAREVRIEGAIQEGHREDQKSAEAQAKYESEMQAARAAGNLDREKLRAEAIKSENEILARVRASTAKTLEEGRKQAENEATQVRAALRDQSKVLARDIATRVLGREVEG